MNRNRVFSYYLSSFLVFFFVFVFVNNLFSFSESNENRNRFKTFTTKSYSVVNFPQAVGDIDFFEKDRPLSSEVKINHISKDIDFEKGLSLYRYQDLIIKMLLKKYPCLDTESADSKYFFRALAENTYSLDGWLLKKTFNSIVDDRAAYLKASKYIDTLKVDTEIKKALKKFYIVSCIYRHKTKDVIKFLSGLSRIPSNSVIYSLEDHPTKSFLLGEYVGGETGENLYYICAAFYDDFTNIPKKARKKILDDIYCYNPTLMIADPIRVNYNFYQWIKNLIFPPEKPRLLKYSMRPYADWLILPKKINIKS